MRNSTDNDDKHQPGFMQPLLPNFITCFSIPKAYVKRLETEFNGETLQTVVLMSQSDPLRHWVVGVEDGRRFTSGWKEFCLHLGFQLGDFLVFTYRSNLLFLVSIFDPVSACQRISSPSPSPTPTLFLQASKRNRPDFNSTRKTETTDNHHAVIPSKEDHSSCCVRLTTYSVDNSIINLPVAFTRQNNLQSRTCQVTIIDAKRRVWSVDMNYKKNDGQVYIKRGWKQVLAANHFKAGYDLCIQFIKGGSCPTLKCFRVHRLGVESSSAHTTIPKETQAEGFTALPSEQDLRDYPSCQVPLSSYAIKRSVISLPKQFLRESGLQYKTYEVKVVDEEERTWLMSLTFQKRNTCLFGGWKNVLAANCFRSGEVICFQLLEAGEFPVLRCYRRSQRKKA